MNKFLDTNIFLRRLEGDKSSIDLLNMVEVGNETYFVSAIVISEIVWVLGSSYERSKQQIVDYINTLLSVRNLKVVCEYDVRRSISLFGSLNIKYNDCVVAATMSSGDMIISFDHDFNKLTDITRVEPKGLLKK